MLWVKCLHVLGVISWMAGIFYLPRIFVHYAEGRAAGEDVRRLLIMANRLYGFMTVLAIVTLGAGLWLWLGFGDGGRWLNVKLLFVAALMGYHLSCRLILGRMRSARPLPGSRALRLMNEAALLIVVPILILAIVKPF